MWKIGARFFSSSSSSASRPLSTRLLKASGVVLAGAGAVTAYQYTFSEQNRFDSAASERLAGLLESARVHAEASRDAILSNDTSARDKYMPPSWIPPTRQEMLNLLAGKAKDGSNLQDEDEGVFDVLIIGGGATGVGCALDAATRGLKTALVERDDFASGTSSRSTKLVHGGVRYLEKAFLELDLEQYKLVREALHERGIFLKIAPYLSYQLPIMLPVKAWWKIPYYWVGAKAYDILAGSEGLSHSYFLTQTRALEAFPMLKKDNIKGAIVYYDGAHNDSRMNVAIAMSAVAHGAVVANHVEVVELLKKPRTTDGKDARLADKELCGAVLRDNLTGKTWTVKCKGVINATGPFTDGIRALDEGVSSKGIVAPSAGVHIILPNYYSPRNMGLIDPNTSDGRVIFFLPWQGSTIAGTTDSPTDVTANPMPSDNDINWILKEVGNYLGPEIRVSRADVLAAWSGIRPLVRDPHAKNTAALVRNHMITVSESGLLTIAGGKWTTYRAMAEETIDKAIQLFDLKPKGPCVTKQLPLVGTANWSRTMFIKLIQHFGLETEVAQHLADSYGDRAWAVASLASQTGARWPLFGVKIASGYPYIEAEIRYACQREYACTAVDVLARRTRLSFLNAHATLEALPRVIDIMASELGWGGARKKQEFENAVVFLKTMGLSIKDKNLYPTGSTPIPENMSSVPSAGSETVARFFARTQFLPVELNQYRTTFDQFDADKDGSISQTDFSKALQSIGLKLSSDELKAVISEVDLNHSGAVEFNEFLEVIAAVKDIRSRSKFARIVADYEDRKKVSTDRSGGGV